MCWSLRVKFVSGKKSRGHRSCKIVKSMQSCSNGHLPHHCSFYCLPRALDGWRGVWIRVRSNDAETLLWRQMFSSLAARETYVGEKHFASRTQNMFSPEVKNIFDSRTQLLRPKHMFPRLATMNTRLIIFQCRLFITKCFLATMGGLQPPIPLRYLHRTLSPLFSAANLYPDLSFGFLHLRHPYNSIHKAAIFFAVLTPTPS